MNTQAHSSWADVYDLAFRRSFGKRYDNLTEQTVGLVSGKVQPPAKILDCGAGTGRLAVPLAERGYKVTAVEPCREMLEQLAMKDTNGQITAICSKIEDLEEEGSYDLALCVFTVISYLLDDQALERSLAAIFNALKPGGRLIIDIPSSVLFRGYSKKEDTFGREVTVSPIADNIYTYKEELMVKSENGDIAHYEDEFHIRHWSEEHVIQALVVTGFEKVENLSAGFAGTGSSYYEFQKA